MELRNLGMFHELMVFYFLFFKVPCISNGKSIMMLKGKESCPTLKRKSLTAGAIISYSHPLFFLTIWIRRPSENISPSHTSSTGAKSFMF
jgi:hypothetical protein